MSTTKDTLTDAFLKTIGAEDKTSSELDGLLDAFNIIVDSLQKAKAANDEKELAKGTIYSTRFLDDVEISQITTFATNKLGRKCKLDNEIDKSLISGFRVVIGDKVIDGSLKNELAKMKNSLLNQ